MLTALNNFRSFLTETIDDVFKRTANYFSKMKTKFDVFKQSKSMTKKWLHILEQVNCFRFYSSVQNATIFKQVEHTKTTRLSDPNLLESKSFYLQLLPFHGERLPPTFLSRSYCWKYRARDMRLLPVSRVKQIYLSVTVGIGKMLTFKQATNFKLPKRHWATFSRLIFSNRKWESWQIWCTSLY